MNGTSPELILYPVFAMFALVAVVLAWMARMRFAAVGRKAMNAEFYRTDDHSPLMQSLARRREQYYEISAGQRVLEV